MASTTDTEPSGHPSLRHSDMNRKPGFWASKNHRWQKVPAPPVLSPPVVPQPRQEGWGGDAHIFDRSPARIEGGGVPGIIIYFLVVF